MFQMMRFVVPYPSSFVIVNVRAYSPVRFGASACASFNTFRAVSSTFLRTPSATSSVYSLTACNNSSASRSIVILAIRRHPFRRDNGQCFLAFIIIENTLDIKQATLIVDFHRFVNSRCVPDDKTIGSLCLDGCSGKVFPTVHRLNCCPTSANRLPFFDCISDFILCCNQLH
ncbi:hypothetical protein [Geobacillus virus E2]|uniref:hypothetical protein n=1 Tax=Geobacillus virus E2 TaxID=447909 RepID=UPI00015367DE|nr:hypothetical protein GBVE2_p09 [Geobacillus virus E2]ABI36827.1 hypothetical protein [Geobacillus virus E2]